MFVKTFPRLRAKGSLEISEGFQRDNLIINVVNDVEFI